VWCVFTFVSTLWIYPLVVRLHESRVHVVISRGRRVYDYVLLRPDLEPGARGPRTN
jgi:hypothetical protein